LLRCSTTIVDIRSQFLVDAILTGSVPEISHKTALSLIDLVRNKLS